MSDSAFTVKVGEKLFTIDRFSLGDWRLLKTTFGLNGSDIYTDYTTPEGDVYQILNVDDPNVIVGLLVVALHHDRPATAVSALVDEVEKLYLGDLDFAPMMDKAKAVDGEDADPTEEGDDSEATDSPDESGKSDKPRKNAGRQSGQKS